MMAIPYHLLKVCGSIIFAARGSDINSFTSTFEHISTWEYPVKQREASCAPSPAAQESPAPEEPPAKRRKVQDGQESTSKGQENGPKATQEKVVNERPFIQGLYVTTDGHHLVAITGSDKTIWVFEHDGAGNLKQLSQRIMPKRPCALALTADNRTILSADKFGDVYALPLIPSNSPSTSPLPPQNLNRSRSSLTPTPSPGPAAALKPQANELTVHTKRNLIALENQKKSLSRKSAEQQSQSSGATPSFEHALLLGHVSMLTAICVATLTTTTTTTTTSISLSNDGQQQPQQQPETRTPTTAKEYILTADRDEHIRVSRGMPQSHVIEGFCLGHDEFVSRLCVAPGGRERVLISGGGDDDLFVWDWPAGRLLCRAGLAGHVKDAMVLVPSGGDGDGGDGNGNGDGQGAGGKQVKVAVTKLLASRWTGCETVVFVACERVPAIFCYNLLDDNTLRHRETVGLPGNPLDVELLGAGRLLVAVDSVTSGEGSSAASSLMVLDQQQAGSEGEAGWRHTPVVPTNESAGGAADINLSTEELQKILYTTESLRKMTDSD